MKNHITINGKFYKEFTNSEKDKFDKMCKELEGLEGFLTENQIIHFTTKPSTQWTKDSTFPNDISERIVEAFIKSQF